MSQLRHIKNRFFCHCISPYRSALLQAVKKVENIGNMLYTNQYRCFFIYGLAGLALQHATDIGGVDPGRISPT
ncbi:hypothetical protein, partial [Thermoflavimicrobium dichotomicum]|uniref:hypothetical protein n=1 Tax=Thermoflavimicrobium dichotomicum TaxID=46223 RepID=UPI001C315FD9